MGFAAFGGLTYLTITSKSNQRLDIRAHQLLSYGVLLVATAHAFWFLLGDGAIKEYLKPGAPGYMWLGVISLLSLAVLVLIAHMPDRMRVHTSYSAFRYWHRIVAIAAIVAAAYHIVASQFYLGTWYQAALFSTLTIAALFGRTQWARLGPFPIATNASYIFVSAIFGALFVALRNMT